MWHFLRELVLLSTTDTVVSVMLAFAARRFLNIFLKQKLQFQQHSIQLLVVLQQEIKTQSLCDLNRAQILKISIPLSVFLTSYTTAFPEYPDASRLPLPFPSAGSENKTTLGVLCPVRSYPSQIHQHNSSTPALPRILGVFATCNTITYKYMQFANHKKIEVEKRVKQAIYFPRSFKDYAFPYLKFLRKCYFETYY